MTREEMPAGRNRRLYAAALSGQGHGPGGCPRRATGAQAPGTPQRARVPIKKNDGLPGIFARIHLNGCDRSEQAKRPGWGAQPFASAVFDFALHWQGPRGPGPLPCSGDVCTSKSYEEVLSCSLRLRRSGG